MSEANRGVDDDANVSVIYSAARKNLLVNPLIDAIDEAQNLIEIENHGFSTETISSI